MTKDPDVEMEVMGKQASRVGAAPPALLALSSQILASGPSNPPRTEAFKQASSCGAVPPACPWGEVGETKPPGPQGHPRSTSTRVIRFCPGF